jgi:16S rRNA (cytidine1402-2'-O)-methyltransferase
MKINHFGTLYIVATPIGNISDWSERAISTLQSVDCIAAEDTRHSLPLLQHFSIKTSLISLHDYNERERLKEVIDRLEQGQSVALISDAGTPLISDPGYQLVHAAKKSGITVIPIPGACAAITALSASGLPTDRFCFEGFLSHKNAPRKQRLTELSHESRTLIFYESPHRILTLLQEMKEIFGSDRQAVIARELTKLFETIHAGTLQELVGWVEGDSNQERGEIVLLVEGAKEIINQSETEKTLTILLDHLPLKQAVEIASKITGERKNKLYEQALKYKNT